MFEYNKDQKYTEKWFDRMIPIWNKIFTQYIAPIEIKNVLEIGCFEGRATSFICEEYLQKDTNYDVVDTFEGSLNESGMNRTAERLLENNFIYDNFAHNISFYPDINFKINKGVSQYILPELEKKGNKYDFIYIDASHRSDDTFIDAYYAHKMLNSKGLLIFDDFEWQDPKQTNLVDSPKFGIRSFYTMYEDLYDIIFKGYQLGLIKK
jgi:SAM-dependent methyltransferase